MVNGQIYSPGKYYMQILTRYIIIIILCCAALVLTDRNNGILVYESSNTVIMQQLRDNMVNQRREQLAELKRHGKTQHGSGPSAEWYYKMHELYYNGIPDKYDNQGNKIKGVAPDPNRSLNFLQQAAMISKNPQLYLKLASIYQNGMYNFKPQLEAAAQLYQGIINMFPYRDIMAEAHEKLAEVMKEIKNVQTYAWLNLKYTPKKNEHHEKIAKMLQQQRGAGNGGLFGYIRNAFGAATETLTRGGLFRADNNFGLDLDDRQQNDAHNTHNSQVVATVANSLKKLQESTDITRSAPESLREIRSYLSNVPESDRRTDALKSLDSIERSILPVSSVGMKEVDALNIVWNRINNHHSDKQDDLKDILYTQLADMQEHGKTVCSTGKLERVIDTLSTFDDNVSIKPTYVINDEMMNKASKVRENIYSEYGQAYGDVRKRMLEEGTAPDQAEYDQKVRAGILDNLRKDYVDTGILTEEKFRSQVDKWIDEI